MAEVVCHFFPKLVELHNYSAANGTAQKLYNWSTLNGRVFKRMGFLVGGRLAPPPPAVRCS